MLPRPSLFLPPSAWWRKNYSPRFMKRKRPEKLSDAPKVTGQVAAQPRGNAGCGCKRGAQQAPRCPRAGPKNAPTARSLRESCSGPARQGRCPPEGHQGLSPVPGSPVRPSPLEGTPATGAALGEERGSQEVPAAAPAAFASAPWVSGVSSVNSAAPQRGFITPETPVCSASFSTCCQPRRGHHFLSPRPPPSFIHC